jgi:hypothetical protein
MNLFIFCILVRLLLVYIAKTISLENLKYVGYVTLMISIGFIYIYITKSRKRGIEIGNKKIWWNQLRPIHGILYLLFSIGAFNQCNLWYLLLLDVIIGMVAYFIHYKIELF